MAEAQEKRVQATALELAKQALHAIEQVRLQQLEQVDKARTMQQERARRDSEEAKRKIDEQMNQALRNCDAQQRQREQQMTQLENMLQRTPTLGHATMQEVAAAAPQSFGPTAYPSAAPGVYAMPAVPPAIPSAREAAGPSTLGLPTSP